MGLWSYRSITFLDDSETKKKGPWGGIYVGPASEMVASESAGKSSQAGPTRVPSQKKKKSEEESKGVPNAQLCETALQAGMHTANKCLPVLLSVSP